jgi:hypothetical protein
MCPNLLGLVSASDSRNLATPVTTVQEGRSSCWKRWIIGTNKLPLSRSGLEEASLIERLERNVLQPVLTKLEISHTSTRHGRSQVKVT